MSVSDLDPAFNYLANDFESEAYSESSQTFRNITPTRKQAIVANAIWHLNQGRELASTLSICFGVNKNFNCPPLNEETVSDLVAKVYETGAKSLQDDLGKSSSININDGVFKYANSSPRRPFLLGHDIVPMNTLSLIGGLGGGGKTQAVIQILVAAATGESYANRKGELACALMLGFEDSQAELTARFSATIKNMSNEKKELAEKNIRVISLIGENFQLVRMVGRNALSTNQSNLIIKAISELKKDTGLDRAVVVIDHARLIASIDWNDSGQVTALTKELHKIAHESSAAILLITHSPKSSANSDKEISQADIAGSAALVDNARYVAIIKTMSEQEAKILGIKDELRKKYIKYECVKSNYCATERIGWFLKNVCENHHVSIHEFVELNKPVPAKIGDTTDESKLIKYIKVNPDLTLTELRGRAGKKTSLGLSDLTVQKLVNKLLSDGLLIYVKPSSNYTKKITSGFKGVLGVADGV